MASRSVSRRDFSKLATVAVGGMIAGSRAAMGQEAKDDEGFPVDPKLLLEDPNVCRGLNTCSGKGKGDHSCAGQSACATVEAHSCHGTNDCKGQGGCGGYPGQNACKEQGQCAVPLGKDTWSIARKQFEQLMKATGKEFGKAPAN